jgi:hypothetical protein
VEKKEGVKIRGKRMGKEMEREENKINARSFERRGKRRL